VGTPPTTGEIPNHTRESGKNVNTPGGKNRKTGKKTPRGKSGKRTPTIWQPGTPQTGRKYPWNKKRGIPPPNGDQRGPQSPPQKKALKMPPNWGGYNTPSPLLKGARDFGKNFLRTPRKGKGLKKSRSPKIPRAPNKKLAPGKEARG